MEKLIERRKQQFTTPQQRVGATWVDGDGTYVRLWAPFLKHVTITWNNGESQTLQSDKEEGYWTGHFPHAQPGDRYIFSDEDRLFPDPASRWQPDGVFGSSAIVAMDYAWSEQIWRGIPFSQWVIYEIHIGTFSPQHNFTAVIADLPRLKRLGINAIEIMPVSQFSGDRNWGYDGVFPHAVQNSYGGPQGLKALVDTAHNQGIAVILDVVYNHIGPEGNVLFSCGPYTQTKYHTPWGDALNFDGENSDHVRRYFLQAAWQWLDEYRLDGLRLDAVQTIFDTSPVPFLEELSLLKSRLEVETGRPLILIAETDNNDSRLLAGSGQNGMGMDAHWADDLHHALHATLTGEKGGYYGDYGNVSQIAHIYQRGVAYENTYSPYRKRFHGRSYDGIDKKRLIVETQNHDQVGNRVRGERLSMLTEIEKVKLAAACVLLSPFTPHLFMGEEFAVKQPFLFFVSHSDPILNEMVRKGRLEEWKSFGWADEPPDPANTATFDACVLVDKSPLPGTDAAIMQDYYRDLIILSKELRTSSCIPSFDAETDCIILEYPGVQKKTVLSFSNLAQHLPMRDGFTKLLFSSSQYCSSPPEESDMIAPFSAVVLGRESP